MAQQLANGKQQFIDGNGNPLAGGSVAFYLPGTLTPTSTWQDAGLTILNANPVILDANGMASIWGADGTLYRQIVSNAQGVQIWDKNVGLSTLPTNSSIQSGALNYAPDTGSTANAYVVSLTPAIPATIPDGFPVNMYVAPARVNTGAATLNGVAIVDRNGNPILGGQIKGMCALEYSTSYAKWMFAGAKQFASIADFGADPTGVADSTAAIQNAIDAAIASAVSLLIPVGKFLVNGTLNISAGNLDIYGEGWLSVLVFGNAGYLTSTTRNVYTIRNVKLQLDNTSTTVANTMVNFAYTFNPTPTPSIQMDGVFFEDISPTAGLGNTLISLSSVRESSFSGCWFHLATSTLAAIQIINESQNIALSGCTFYGDAIYTVTQYAVVVNGNNTSLGVQGVRMVNCIGIVGACGLLLENNWSFVEIAGCMIDNVPVPMTASGGSNLHVLGSYLGGTSTTVSNVSLSNVKSFRVIDTDIAAYNAGCPYNISINDTNCTDGLVDGCDLTGATSGQIYNAEAVVGFRASNTPGVYANTFMRAHTNVASQAIAAATATLVEFNVADVDNLGELNASTYVFTAKQAGLYRLTASVGGSSATAGDRQLSYNHNGASINLAYQSGATSFTTVSGTDSLILAAGDTLSIYYTNSVADNINNDAGLTRFCVERVPT